MEVNCAYMMLMYVIYRGLRLRDHDLDQEFSRRESWEYYLLDRDTFESDGLEARGIGNIPPASSMTNIHFNLVDSSISKSSSEPSRKLSPQRRQSLPTKLPSQTESSESRSRPSPKRQ